MRRGFIASAAMGLALTVAATVSASAAGQSRSLNAEELVPALGAPQGVDDVLPRDSSFGQMANDAGIVPGSARLLARSSYGEHWVASNEDGDICIITKLGQGVGGHPGDGEIAGGSCMPRLTFFRLGAAVKVEGSPKHGVLAYLLPPNVDPASVRKEVAGMGSGAHETELFTRESSELVVIDSASDTRGGDLDVSRDDGEPLVLPLPF